MKLKKLYENTQETVFTPEQKRSFIEAVKRFNEYGDQVYRTEGIRKAVKEISTVVKQAEQLTIQETQDWFDGVAVKRCTDPNKSGCKAAGGGVNTWK